MPCAIVHYWLLNMRGGERVLEALCELYPDADSFTQRCSTLSTEFPLEERVGSGESGGARCPACQMVYARLRARARLGKLRVLSAARKRGASHDPGSCRGRALGPGLRRRRIRDWAAFRISRFNLPRCAI
jgi:hypothetical protein